VPDAIPPSAELSRDMLIAIDVVIDASMHAKARWEEAEAVFGPVYIVSSMMKRCMMVLH
jgi:hypothetical protein